MKISRNSILKSILFIGFLIAIFAPIGKSDAIILVRVNAPAFATVNSPISITASTYYSTDYIGIYVDGSVIKECTGFVNSCSSTFVTSSSIKNHKIQAYADNYGFATTYTRLRFSIPSGSDSIFGISYSTWYSNARDFARSPDSSTVWDRAYKILQTYNNGQGI